VAAMASGWSTSAISYATHYIQDPSYGEEGGQETYEEHGQRIIPKEGLASLSRAMVRAAVGQHSSIRRVQLERAWDLMRELTYRFCQLWRIGEEGHASAIALNPTLLCRVPESMTCRYPPAKEDGHSGCVLCWCTKENLNHDVQHQGA